MLAIALQRMPEPVFDPSEPDDNPGGDASDKIIQPTGDANREIAPTVYT